MISDPITRFERSVHGWGADVQGIRAPEQRGRLPSVTSGQFVNQAFGFQNVGAGRSTKHN